MPPVLAETFVAAVATALEALPILPEPEVKLTVVPVTVNAPVTQIQPEPLALNVAVPVAPELTLPLMNMLPLELDAVAKLVLPLPVSAIAPSIVNVLLAVNDTVGAPVDEIAPVFTPPRAVTVRFFVPSVIVAPVAE